MQRKKLSKKTALIGAIVIMVIWFAIWGYAYWYLSNGVNDASRRGFVDDAKEFLAADTSFGEKYGKLTALDSDDEQPIKDETGETVAYYMDFVCTTSKGEVRIRVTQTWNEEWVLSYQELPAE